MCSTSSGLGGYRRGGKFCPVCGRETDKLVGGLCPECYAKTHPLAPEGLTHLRATICQVCGAYMIGREWRNPRSMDVQDVLSEIAVKSVKRAFEKRNIKVVRVEVESIRSKKTGYNLGVMVELEGSPSPDVPPYTQEVYVRISVGLGKCPACKAVMAKTEKAIVQIRAKNRKLTDAERKTATQLLRYVVNKLYRTDRTAVPVRVDESDSRIDIAFASRSPARALVSELRRKMPVEVLETHKDLGVDRRGMRKTRVTYRVLLPTPRRGDVIELNGEAYYVMEVRGRYAKCLQLPLYREVKLDVHALHKANVSVLREKIRLAVVISSTHDIVQLMITDTYEVVEVRVSRALPWLKEQSRVGIVKLKGKVIPVPLMNA